MNYLEFYFIQAHFTEFLLEASSQIQEILLFLFFSLLKCFSIRNTDK